jgi:hypothetical protein
MEMRHVTERHMRQCIIEPLPKKRGRIVVTQMRTYDARQMGGLGGWQQPLIEWATVTVTVGTAGEADAMATALQEAANIYRTWEQER